MTTGVVIELRGCTDVGLVRKDNQDCFLVGDLDRHQCLEPDEAARYMVQVASALVEAHAHTSLAARPQTVG